MTDPRASDDRRLLVIAESDSFIKWAACLVDTLPPGWLVELVVLSSMKRPSPRQIASAVLGTTFATEPPAVIGLRTVIRHARNTRPDAILIATTGPIADALTHRMLPRLTNRPVVLAGIPGLAMPAGLAVWPYRCLIDLLVVHSRSEVRAFRALAEAFGVSGRPALAGLPYLKRVADPPPARDLADRVGPKGEEPTTPRVVFAAQAKVPVGRAEREAILMALADLARSHPELDVVVKLRGQVGEQQTHHEALHYFDLWTTLAHAEGFDVDLLRFESSSMAEALVGAIGLASVSSTALIEGMAAKVPVLVLSDFGVSAEMINVVFEDSGCLGSLDDLRKGNFLQPSALWTAENYLHPESESNAWILALDELLAARNAGTLQAPQSLTTSAYYRRIRLREELLLRVPPAVARSIGALRRLARAALSVVAPTRHG